ncbi:MAG TPA: hypothetical protein VFF11_01980, partial [Candidatus Binatia bacterium]|nr:hypothetical protein [Candidatus Binatia bacterium]
MWKQMTMGLLLVFVCGCIRTKDELTINADGSGKVRMETKSSIPPELTENMGMGAGMMGMGDGIIYPPVSEAEARKFFPGNDFTVAVDQQTATNGDVTTVITAEFKDINKLLASPYGHAHELSVTITNGSLCVQGVSGMEAAALLAETKDDSGMSMMAMPGLADLQKKKGEMRDEFVVTLPNAITKANGKHAGKTASWLVERAKCKDGEDFARQLGALCEASCSADGLTLSPVTPLHMGLLPFGQMATGAANTGVSVDTNKIAAAAKFVPYGVSVTRSLDLSGAGNVQGSSAELIGAIELPRQFAPQKWGKPTLDEVVDAAGKDLKPNNSNDGFMYRSGYSSMFGGDAEDATTNNIQKHVFTVDFRPPDWKIKEITKIKGSVGLQYFGDAQVVKLTNAIPANWIMDVAKMMAGGGFDSSEKKLSSATLAALGLSLSEQMATAQGGMMMLMLQVRGKQAALTD